MVKKIATTAPLLLLLLAVAVPVLAQGRTGSPVEISVQGGEISAYGRTADLRVELRNNTPVTLRIVALSFTYDTISRNVVQLASTAEFQLLLEPAQTRTEQISFLTDVPSGEIIDWPRPQRIDVAVGADVQALAEAVAEVGTNPDDIVALMQAIDRITQAARAARTHHAQAVNRLPEPDRWFDWETISGLRPELEAALCSSFGRRIAQQRNARNRVEAYQTAAATLLANTLYPDCLPADVRLQVARALIETNHAQDALVLTVRDENGEVSEQWREIYIRGRLALASDIAHLTTPRQFWPPMESLNEVKRLDPENSDLPPVADNLLRKVAEQVDYLLRNESEAEASQLVGLMRQQWSDHPQVQRASRALAEGLLRYANRSLARDNLIGANNAYAIGVQHLEGVPEWEAILPQIQDARRNYFVNKAESAIASGNLNTAEEALTSAGRMAALDPEIASDLNNRILQARWNELNPMIEQGRFEDVLRVAQQLEGRAENLEVFGEARARTYLDLAEAIWNKYGIFAGLANRTRITMAEQAIELGRSTDPQRASALATRLLLARWLIPGILLFLVVLGGTIMIVRASWRKRLQARGLWHRGIKLCARDRLSAGIALMEKAYNLTAFDDRAPAYLGEESRGHLILQIAAANRQRERDDQVAIWQGEWLALPELERPFSIEFDQALQQFTKGAPAPPPQQPPTSLAPAQSAQLKAAPTAVPPTSPEAGAGEQSAEADPEDD
ncbi:MAG: hypothetical protein JW797_18105 [Bradymonadales bacterium]|nr:hypothetical protein [Bradymonadales bacterium]